MRMQQKWEGDRFDIEDYLQVFPKYKSEWRDVLLEKE
jgi:hypothetical protein